MKGVKMAELVPVSTLKFKRHGNHKADSLVSQIRSIPINMALVFSGSSRNRFASAITRARQEGYQLKLKALEDGKLAIIKLADPPIAAKEQK